MVRQSCAHAFRNRAGPAGNFTGLSLVPRQAQSIRMRCLGFALCHSEWVGALPLESTGDGQLYALLATSPVHPAHSSLLKVRLIVALCALRPGSRTRVSLRSRRLTRSELRSEKVARTRRARNACEELGVRSIARQLSDASALVPTRS